MTSAPVQRCQPKVEPVRQHTPTPWSWNIHDSSAASLTGPDEMMDHVLTVSPCEHCRGEEWEWGVCTNPSQADAAFIVEAVNSHASLKARLEQAERAVDVLESNARVQAKLLADTGRRAEELEGALRQARTFIDPEADPPGFGNREMVRLITAALEAKPAGEMGK